MRRISAWQALKIAFYVAVLIGLAVYFYGLYETRGEWRVEAAGAPRLGMASPGVLRVEMPLKIYNPDSRVTAKLVYYRVYINGVFAGDGLIPYLDLPPGWSTQVVRAEIDLSRAGCGVAVALARGENLTIALSGYAMVDLRLFGKIAWKTVTVPFNFTAGEVEAPRLDPASQGVVGLYAYACTHSTTILGVLESLTGNTSLPSWPPVGGGSSGGGNQTQGLPQVTYRLEGAGLSYTLVVNITNPGPGAMTVESVTYNGRSLLQEPRQLAPGETLVVRASGVEPTGILQVETDRGTVRLAVHP